MAVGHRARRARRDRAGRTLPAESAVPPAGLDRRARGDDGRRAARRARRAVAMQFAGMSMALGAFLAGLLLAESNFRHQLEADIEPFRGLLLGLFFMSVGMGMDAALIARQRGCCWRLRRRRWSACKIAIAYRARALARLRRQSDALRSAALLAPAGEFSFVLLPLAGTMLLLLRRAQASLAHGAGRADHGDRPGRRQGDRSSPWCATPRAGPSRSSTPTASTGVTAACSSSASAASASSRRRCCWREGVDVTVIDKDVARIQAAATLRLQGLLRRRHAARRAARGRRAECTHRRGLRRRPGRRRSRSWSCARQHFPLAQIHARAYDRIHAVDLLNAGRRLPDPRDAALGAGVRPGDAGGHSGSSLNGPRRCSRACASATSSGWRAAALEGSVLPAARQDRCRA